MDSVKKIALTYKEQLITNDTTVQQNAVLGIKQYFEVINSDSFVKIILDLDIHTLLLNHLLKSHFAANLDILKCIEYLCSYKIYFINNHAVSTAEVILKNIFSLVKSNLFDTVLLESLKIITKIIENLNDYNTKGNLTFHIYLTTIRSLLTHNKNNEIISTTIKMYSALLLHEKFQNNINNDVITDIEDIWTLALQRLYEIFYKDARNSVVGLSKLCDSILRMLSKMCVFKQDKIDALFQKVQDFSVNVLTNVCIPFIDEFGLHNDICVEYLCFLKTILITIYRKDVLKTICKQLVFSLNFTVITKYLEKSTTISNKQEQDEMRKLCLSILCEIIINLNDISSFSYNSDEKCKKYLFKSLESLQIWDVSVWLLLLQNAKIDLTTKLSIIKFCTMYYVYSENATEIQPKHLYSYIEFLRRFPPSVNVNIYYLQDILLLFAAVVCANHPNIPIDSALFKPTATLERLIAVHDTSFDKIFIFHPYILFWLFMNPYIKNSLKDSVMSRWLILSNKDPSVRLVLPVVICEFPQAAQLLLTKLQQGAAEYSAAAAYSLRTALKQGSLAKNKFFTQELSVAVAASITTIKKDNIVRDKVASCIYMLHLSSFISTPEDKNILQYSIESFTSSVGPLGVQEVLPPFFYTNALDYVQKILESARDNRVKEVYTSFMSSKQMLHTLMGALVCNNQKMSQKAAQIFYNLLDYQIYNKLYCRNTIVIKKEFLIQLLSVEDTQQLELNLQILKTLLFKTTKLVLDLEIDDHMLQGLYFRCLNLVSKPSEHSFAKTALTCLEGLLRYTQIHNNIEVQDLLCHHSGNHVMIMTFFDKETSRPIERPLLSFIYCWLQFSVNRKENIMNRLSINYTFWKMSIYQIAVLILHGDVDSKSDNADLTNGILKQLCKLSELLPDYMANYFKTIEENLS